MARHRYDEDVPKHVRRVRFYHASPRRFRHGDVLTGNHEGGCGSKHPNVCLTTSPAPHITISRQAEAEDWYVYEVEPLYEVVRPDNGWHELQVRAARVLRLVGRAGALAAHARARRGRPGMTAEDVEKEQDERGLVRGKYFSRTGAAYSWVPERPMRKVRVVPSARRRGRRWR